MVYYKFYHYEPSLAAACGMAVLFGVMTTYHMLLVFRHRTRFFIPVIIGGACKQTAFNNRSPERNGC